MARKEVKGPITDNALNNINHNFIELYNEFVSAGMNAQEALNKVNQMVGIADNALKVAKQSDSKSDDTQQQLDDIILKDGNDIAEVVQARGGEPLLKDRLNKTDAQLAETEKQAFYDSTISHKEPTFMVTIIDDDGHRGFYTKYFELAKEYNIPITSAMITGMPMGFPWDNRPYNNRYYHYDEIMEMRDSGLIEFISHSHTHPAPITEVSRDDLYEDYKTSREVLKRLGLNHRAIVQPGGRYDERIHDITRSLFSYGFRGRNNILEVTTPPLDNFGIHRLSIEQHDFEAKIKTEIDAAKELSGWLVFIGHVDQDYGWTEQKTRQVIEYVHSQGGKFVTTQEGINNHGNLLQAGDISISPKGKTFGNIGNVVFNSNEVKGDNLGITNDSDITDFEHDKITYTLIRRSQIEGFPDRGNGNSGVLTTYRLAAPWYWNYQTFRRTSEGTQYFRYYTEDGVWGEWQAESVYRVDNSYAVDNNTDLTYFEKGTVTQSMIRSSQLPGFPSGEGNSGSLTTYYTSNEWWTNYQKFKRTNDPQTYIRYWQEDGTWGEWQSETPYRVAPKPNTYTGLSKIDDFPVGTTVFYVQGGQYPEGTPTGSGGIFTTVKVSSNEPAWNYQEFVQYNTSDKYIRNAKPSGEWSNWKKYVLETI